MYIMNIILFKIKYKIDLTSDFASNNIADKRALWKYFLIC
jgi:hypothetical protein